jgi:NAD(P)-dependent dehydrogenase (short-subunit alcohol dehydrogenase family)
MTAMTTAPDRPLVAVVTGASRGLGRGMAVALGAAGAIVYVTGRSTARPTGDWAGTVGETAAAVTAAGGQGIAVACDHADDARTEALFQAVARDHGRLDILVNNAFGMPDWAAAPGRFWERPLALWEQEITVGARSSYVASCFAVPLMLGQGRGLLLNTSGRGARGYLHGLPYGIGKAAQDKMAHDMAHELRGTGIAAVSLWPGLLRTERTLATIARNPEHYADRGGAENAESPELLGRVAVALYRDPDLMRLSGGTFYSAELARHYGLTEADGRRPVSYRALFGAPLYDPVDGPVVLRGQD